MSLTTIFLLALLPAVWAATAEQWRSRSIYQLITDRYALPSGADTNACDLANQTWCGGTWNTITANLDYIQDAGFTAVWISPTSQNYYGPRSDYGDAYHGYWIANVTQLNDKFGTEADLKALIAELHKRDMYIMIDVVVNNVMTTSLNYNASGYYDSFYFTDPSQYHSYCPVDYSNTTSEELCWLGDTNVPLPDLNTEDPSVVDGYTQWIKSFVQEFDVDGLRIDAAKHVDIEFWPQFCGNASVFCIGEVDTADPTQVAPFQGPQGLDSVLGYPMYGALVEAFAIPGPGNISAVTTMMAQQKQLFPDTTVLGNFLENQDNPRWHNLSVDPQSLFNAMVFTFMSDGIPIVYYGQEQGFSGNADPFNREALWTSGYAKTPTYQLMQTLNQLRNFLANQTSSTWLTAPTNVLASSNIGLAIQKGNVISVLTNIGSPPANSTMALQSNWVASTPTTNILTCEQWAVGASGWIDVEYTLGGVPVILVPSNELQGSGLCGTQVESTNGNAQLSGALSSRTAGWRWWGVLLAGSLLVSGMR